MSNMMTSKMSNGQSDGQIDVGDMFGKLMEWRSESNRQFMDILDSHRSSISKGMNNLVEEIFELRGELSVIRKEKAILLEAVDDMKSERRQMSAKTLSHDNLHNQC